MKKNKIFKITVEKLMLFKQKGGAWQSQAKAIKILSELKLLLTEQEWWELHLAHVHYETGDNTHEIYDVANKLISKYEKL